MQALKSNKGITMISVTVLIIAMVIITSMLVYNSLSSYRLKDLNNMNNDLQVLEDNIRIYHAKNGKLPILDAIPYIGMAQIYADISRIATPKNPYDNDVYYVIDINLLENLTLTNGKAFDEYKSGSTDVTDIYIINEETHTVYYAQGVEVKGQYYHTLVRNFDESNIDYQIANAPVLTEGMIPVKYNEEQRKWQITSKNDLDWYRYNDTDKKWANIMLSDGKYKYSEDGTNDPTAKPTVGTLIEENELGSMFVWVPRYAYKIPESNIHTGNTASINIKFLKGNTNKVSTGVAVKVVKPDKENELKDGYNKASDYIQHPAFTFGDDELEGIWVAKFTASIYQTSNNTNLQQPVTGGQAITDTSSYYIKSVPNAYAWRYTNISNMFLKALDMKNDLHYELGESDTHLMKNTELGAISYLSNSSYGSNSQIWINNDGTYKTGRSGNSSDAAYNVTTNAYDTGTGINASSTGNITGIYDLSGGTMEYVAAYLNNGNTNLTTNGEELVKAPDKYKNTYIEAAAKTNIANYANAINRVGDAIYETSPNGTNTSPYSWYGDSSLFMQNELAFISRTGLYSGTTSAGSFAYQALDGTAKADTSFRPVIVIIPKEVAYKPNAEESITNPETGLPEIPEPTNETTLEFTRAYGVIEIAWLDLNNNVIANPISPKDYLGGMTPVKWTGTPGSYTESTTTSTDTDWYSYVKQTEDADGRTSRWANAKAVSGGNEAYFVWCPRYAYKIIYFNSATDKENYRKGISTANIVGYSTIHGMVNVVEGNKIQEGTEPTNVVGTVKTTGYRDYIPHPGFEFDGAKGGIWVGKYESSGSTSTVKIKPNVASLRSINVSTMFTASLGVKTTYSLNNIDSHMMKNVEWGAVAYLAESRYGRNGTEIYINNSSSYITGNSGGSTNASSASGTTNAYNTANGVLASTTGNIHGIYDLSGGAWEYVAGYINNSNVSSSGYNGNMLSADVKYRDVYAVGTTDNQALNYKANKGKKGDATHESSTSYSGYNSWNADFSSFTYASGPVFKRGGSYDSGSTAGVFSFDYNYGSDGGYYSFRVVLLPL